MTFPARSWGRKATAENKAPNRKRATPDAAVGRAQNRSDSEMCPGTEIMSRDRKEDEHGAFGTSPLPLKSCLPGPGKASGFEFAKLITSARFVNFES